MFNGPMQGHFEDLSSECDFLTFRLRELILFRIARNLLTIVPDTKKF